MKVKTKDLSGIALDWAVAKCEEVLDEFGVNDIESWSSDWRLAGPIIEREKIAVYPLDGGAEFSWTAQMYDENNRLIFQGLGFTPLEAAMRCYVGNTQRQLEVEIEVPDDLI